MAKEKEEKDTVPIYINDREPVTTQIIYLPGSGYRVEIPPGHGVRGRGYESFDVVKGGPLRLHKGTRMVPLCGPTINEPYAPKTTAEIAREAARAVVKESAESSAKE